MNSLYPTASFPVYALRFAIFIVALIFPVGNLVLHVLRVNFKSRLENVAFSLLIGILSTNLIYFFLRWYHHEKFFLAIALSLVILWLFLLARDRFDFFRNFFSRPVPRITVVFFVLLLFLFFLQIVIPVLFQNYVVWGNDGSLKLANGAYSDAIWRITVASELERSVPPYIPVFANGGRLVYHYFSGLFSVLASFVTGIDILSLRFSLMNMFVFLLVGVFIYIAFSRIFRSRAHGTLAFLFVMLFGPGMCSLANFHHNFVISLFLGVLLLVSMGVEANRKAIWLLIVYLISQSMMYESFLSVFFIGSIGIGALLVLIWHKDWRLFVTIGLGGVLALVFQYFAVGKLRGGCISLDFPLIVEAVRGFKPARSAAWDIVCHYNAQGGLSEAGRYTFNWFADLVKPALARVNDKTIIEQLIMLPFYTVAAVSIYLVKTFKLSTIAMPLFLKKVRHLKSESVAMCLYITILAVGIALPFFVGISFFWNAIFRPFNIAVSLFYALVAVVVYNLWLKRSFLKVCLLVFVGIFSVFSISYKVSDTFKNSKFYALKTSDEIEILNYLRTETPSVSVLMHPFIDDPIFEPSDTSKPAWIFKNHYYYGSSLGGKHVVCEGAKYGCLALFGIAPEVVDLRRADIKTVFETKSKKEAQQILEKYRVDYLWVPNTHRLKFPTGTLLKPIVENENHTLYSVIRKENRS